MGLTNNEILTRGPIGRYYMSDVGFVGVLAKTGLQHLFCMVLCLLDGSRLLKMRKTSDYRYTKHYGLLIVLAVYFIAQLCYVSISMLLQLDPI